MSWRSYAKVLVCVWLQRALGRQYVQSSRDIRLDKRRIDFSIAIEHNFKESRINRRHGATYITASNKTRGQIAYKIYLNERFYTFFLAGTLKVRWRSTNELMMRATSSGASSWTAWLQFDNRASWYFPRSDTKKNLSPDRELIATLHLSDEQSVIKSVSIHENKKLVRRSS